MNSRVENPILDGNFFIAQDLLTPGVGGNREGYFKVADAFQCLLVTQAVALATARAPMLTIEQALGETTANLQARRRWVVEEPVPGDWKALVAKARTELGIALSKNTVPYPLIPLARLVGLPEHPDILALSQQEKQLRAQYQVASKETLAAEKTIAEECGGQVNKSRKEVIKERDKLLARYESAVAQSGTVETVAEYLKNLPLGVRLDRIAPAVNAFVGTNGVDLLQTSALGDFKAIARRVASNKPRSRIEAFTEVVKDKIATAEEARVGLSLEGFRDFDGGYPWRRWEGYLSYLVEDQLYHMGAVETPVKFPEDLFIK